MHREREKHMKRVTPFAVLGLALTIAGTTVVAQETLDRTVLPIAEPTRQTYSLKFLQGKCSSTLVRPCFCGRKLLSLFPFVPM
jgi:hypothetical protein